MTGQENTSNISCREALDLIVLYLDDHANDIERTVLQQHLEACRHCFDRVEFEKVLRERLRGLTTDPPSERLREKVESLLSEF